MALNELQELLGVDIGSTTDTYIDDMTDLLSENRGIFSNSNLPFHPTKELLNQLSLYNSVLERWIIPEIPRSESKHSKTSIADFLNNICQESKENIHQRPNIILVDFKKISPVTWSSVQSITEVTTQDL
jgi:hypothetical protein